MEELNNHKLADARRLARQERIRNIRRRITIGAGTLVAIFSGLVLFRSIDEQTASAEPTSAATNEGSDESNLLNQVVSVFGEDDHEGDDDDDSEDDGSIFSIFTPSSDPAPMTSSQS